MSPTSYQTATTPRCEFPPVYQLGIRHATHVRKQGAIPPDTFYYHGAEAGIRTQASLTRPTGFQDRTLQPLGYFCICTICGSCRVRTYDLSFRRRILYPTELRVQKMVETAGVAPTYVHWSSDWCQIFYDENTGPKMLINILIGTHECQGIIYSLTAS